METSKQTCLILIAALLAVVYVYEKSEPFALPFALSTDNPKELSGLDKGFRCSQKERIPTKNSLQDVVENLYQKTVNKVTTNLAGTMRQDPKAWREMKLKASLRGETEPLSFHENERVNVYSKSSYELERDKVDRVKQSATRMQNDVPLAHFTTFLGDAAGASGASRYLHGVRELPHVPLTKAASSLKAITPVESFESGSKIPLVGGDVSYAQQGLGIYKTGFSRENYSNIGLIDKQPKAREYDGTNRFFKGHQKEGGTQNNRNILGGIEIERHGDFRGDAVEMSRGTNKNTNSPYIGEVHQRGRKEDGLHQQRMISGKSNQYSVADKYSRGVEARREPGSFSDKPEVNIGDRHWLNAKATHTKPTNIYTEYEHSYK